jgi:2,4-dienoyl-CoA reductase-like NADH-dependent reductase (Old Yellow Enzyme family)
VLPLGTSCVAFREDVLGSLRAQRARLPVQMRAPVTRYLLSQFLTPFCNRRRDRYGGPLARDRVTFPLEVNKQCLDENSTAMIHVADLPLPLRITSTHHSPPLSIACHQNTATPSTTAHSHACAPSHTHTHARTHAHTRTRTHAHAHTHTHTHTHTHRCWQLFVGPSGQTCLYWSK